MRKNEKPALWKARVERIELEIKTKGVNDEL